MKGLLCTVVLLSACAQVVPADKLVDPYPAAEEFIWNTLLGMKDVPKPTTQYIDHVCEDGESHGLDRYGFCVDGVFDAWERIVIVERQTDTLPSQSFLCYGYTLAHYSPFVHDPYLTYDQFYLADPFIYGAFVQLCQDELRREYDYKVE